MTPEERAEKMVTKFNGEGACLSNTDEAYLQELIAKALSAMRNEALEEAAKVSDARERFAGTRLNIGDEIRAGKELLK